jgi:hypothetical protein
MSSFQVVAEKVAQVASLTAGFVSQAASSLVGNAEKLSLDEISRRLDGALRALRGEEVSTSGAATTSLTTAKTSLQLAHEMVESYTFDKKTGVSTFTVPAGVTDVEAMKALNEYFRKNHPTFNRDAVYADNLEWLENLPKKFPGDCEQRDYSQARQITITGVVEGTQGLNRTTLGSVLRDDSLVFSDPRDQAIAAALHACKHDGQDLFKDLWVRGSVPGFALYTNQRLGVLVDGYIVDYVRYRFVAASGSPSPELK